MMESPHTSYMLLLDLGWAHWFSLKEFWGCNSLGLGLGF